MSQAIAEDESTLIQAVRDRYRCPEGFLDFRLSEGLSPEAGYFQFGAATCYGRTLQSAHQAQLSSPLRATQPGVSFDGNQLVLPFDPNEIIDNLRLERYPSSQLGTWEKALKDIYYRLRPLTNRPLRKSIQRLRAVNWEKRHFPQWPGVTTVRTFCKHL